MEITPDKKTLKLLEDKINVFIAEWKINIHNVDEDGNLTQEEYLYLMNELKYISATHGVVFNPESIQCINASKEIKYKFK